MLIDAHAVDKGRRIEADVCVIGTGPAGITLLKTLSAPHLRVVALESGGQSVSPAAEALCDGKIISRDNYPDHLLRTSRRRQLGGTANLWNDQVDAGQGDELLRLVTLDAIDFEKRSWVPYSGWPFGRSELAPFYEHALSVVGEEPSADAELPRNSNHSDLLLPHGRFRTVLSRFGARSIFTTDYPTSLARAENISVYLNATVLELMLRDNAVTSARVAATPEREFHVAAKFFILATGGIENARLLLLSNKTQAHGIGNQHDLVGRFFMDHPSFRLGLLTPNDRAIFDSVGLYDHQIMNGRRVMGKFTFREETMRQEELLNLCVTLTPRGCGYESPATKIVHRLMRSDSPETAVQLLRQEFSSLVRSWDDILARAYQRLAKKMPVYFENKGGWSRLPKRKRRFRRFELCCLAEQAPNPENRVTLGNALDRFGQRQTQLHWQWSEIDLRSIRRAQDILKEELEEHRLGQFVKQHELDDNARPQFSSPHHHIGTTRMHDDPKQGVVNAECRVHDVANLFVAGSSVFPTGGFANPTLTIVALALRLSYHLKELMKAPVSSVSRSVSG